MNHIERLISLNNGLERINGPDGTDLSEIRNTKTTFCCLSLRGSPQQGFQT